MVTVEDQQLRGAAAEWESGTVLCELKTGLQDSFAIWVGRYVCSWLPPVPVTFIRFWLIIFSRKDQLWRKSCVFFSWLSGTPWPPADFHHLQSFFSFWTFSTFKLCAATKSHQQQYAFTASLRPPMRAVAAVRASLQTGPGGLLGCTRPPEDKTSAATLTSAFEWQWNWF